MNRLDVHHQYVDKKESNGIDSVNLDISCELDFDVTERSSSTSSASSTSFSPSTISDIVRSQIDNTTNNQKSSTNLLKTIPKRLFSRLTSSERKPKPPCTKSKSTLSSFYNEHNEDIISIRNCYPVDRKCFRKDHRANLDVQLFGRQPRVLFLDTINQNYHENLASLMELMLKEIFPEKDKVPFEIHNSLYNLDNFQFYNYIQGVIPTKNDDMNTMMIYDDTWCCVYGSVDRSIMGANRGIMICRLSSPINFGPTLQHVRLMVIVLTEPREKSSKNSWEIARTFASLLANSTIRNRLLDVGHERKFVQIILNEIQMARDSEDLNPEAIKPNDQGFRFSFGKGIRENFQRRLSYYCSDYRDGLDSWPTLQKVCSSTMTLFFACILPCVAFGVLNYQETDGKIGPKEALLGQAVGGLIFALISGQPLVIIATTAPLCLYTAIVNRIAGNLNVDFFDLFAMVGIWNTVFCILYSLFDLSQLMNFCTRSTEEIFSTFIFFAFTIEALKECIECFKNNYCFSIGPNETTTSTSSFMGCAPEKSILFILLMFGTFILAIMLYNFSKTPYLCSFIRTNLADYSLPVSVIVFAFIGSYAFSDVDADRLLVSSDYRWHLATLSTLTPSSILISIVLGLALSMLFFIDQNISAALVSAPGNHLRKGDAFHWDLFVVALINLGLSLIGYPWMHGILPHSPMHARSLADVQTIQSTNGQQQTIVVRSRETRITGLMVHLLITVVTICIPFVLSYIPVAVLSGLFLYCAASTLRNNSLYERVLLMITEQKSYPPMKYLRKCPQRLVHKFTMIQLLQLLIICAFGFAPFVYVQLIFPLIIAMLIPIRFFILPRIIDEKYLKEIDNKHY